MQNRCLADEISRGALAAGSYILLSNSGSFLQAQLEGEGAEVADGEPGAATESASAADDSGDDSGSELSAAWESELEDEECAEAHETKESQ